jgi:serine/threonine-protein kinase HipA
MSINGKRDGFLRDDFRICAKTALMKRGRADSMLDEVLEVVGRWQEFATRADVAPAQIEGVGRDHRLAFQ